MPKPLLTCILLAAVVAQASAQARLDQYGDPLPAGALQRLGTARLLHAGGGVRHLAFDPDGALLASVGDDYVIRLWDTVTGQQVQAFSDRRYSVESLAYSPDGKTLAAGTYGMVQLWEVRSGKELRQLGLPFEDVNKVQYVNAVAFSTDGKILASGCSDGFLRLWDPATGKERKAWRASDDYIKRIALSPDGKLLASSDKDGAVRIWGLATARELRRLAGSHSFVVFSPNSELLATVDGGGNSCVFEVATGKKIETNYHGPVYLSFSADNRLAFAVNTIGLWRRPKGEEWTYRSDLFEEHSWRSINCAAISSDGRLFATGGSYGRVCIHDLERDKPRGHRPGHKQPVTAVAFSPDGKHVYSGSEDGAIRQWDADTGKEQRTVSGPGHSIMDMALSPDGKRIASVSGESATRLLDATTGRELWTIKEPGYSANKVVFARDGRSVFASNHGTLWQFDSATGKELNKHILNARGGINCIAVAPEGKLIAYPTVAWGSSPKFRELESEKEWPCVSSKTKSFDPDYVRHMLFSPDDKLLVMGQDRGFVVVDTATRKIVWSVEWLGGAASFAFSRDGKLLAAGGRKDIRLFDAADGKEVATFRADAQSVKALAFSSDSKRLAAGSDDTSVLVWATGR